MIYVAFSLVALNALTAYFLYDVVRRQSNRDARLDEERQTLLNRIQSPETAIAQSIGDNAMVEAIPHDDDDAYWEKRAKQKLGLGE